MGALDLTALELRHYRYFVTLVDEAHFARAAERLGISQPALSQQLRAIEQGLGAELLIRARRRLELTEIGRVLYEHGRILLGQNDVAQRALLQASRGFVGRLAIGYVASAALSGVLPKIVYRFRQGRPDVEIVLKEMDMLDQLGRIVDGSIDVGFIRPPVPDFPEGVSTFEVLDEPMLVVLHRNHRLANKKQVQLSDLRDDTFICTHTVPGLGFFAITKALCEAAGFEPKTAVFSPQASVLISMVAAGFGVSLVPASASGFAPEDVVFARLSTNPVRSKLSMVHARRNHSPALEAFLAAAREWSRPGRKTSVVPTKSTGRMPS